MQITVAKLRPCYRVTRVSSRAALTAMSCASSAATWALSLLSQSQHNTYDVIALSYGSATTRYGATRTFARRSFGSNRICNITCSALSRTAWSFACPRAACTSSSAAALSFARCSYSVASCCACARLPRSDRRAVAAYRVRLLLLLSAPHSGVFALEDLAVVADALEFFYICLVRMPKVVPVALL